MNNYVRVTAVEDSFNSLHGINPQIYQQKDGSEIRNKLILGGKEIILREVIERGLTKDAFLTYAGETFRFDRVFKAEEEAVKIFRG